MMLSAVPHAFLALAAWVLLFCGNASSLEQAVWGKTFAFGSNSERIALRSTIEASQGIYLCKSSPEPLESTSNLANPYSGLSLNGWKGFGLASILSSSGINVLKAKNIANSTDGPEMDFSYLGPGSFKFSVWVKADQINSGQSYILAAIRSPGQAVTAGRVIATGLAKTQCWTKIQGGFTLLTGTNVTLKMGGMPANSVMYLASLSVESVDPSSDTIQKNAIISQIRKRDVSLKILDKHGDPFAGFVEVDQIENDFPFGGSTSGALLVNQAYQAWFRKRFSWTVYEDEAKWYSTDFYPPGTQHPYNSSEPWYNPPPFSGDHYYQHPDDLTSYLLSVNISIRGHNVLWDVPGWAQEWLSSLTSDQLRSAVNEHVRDIVTRFKGKFLHWDVVNEVLHGQYFETSTGDKNFTAEVYKAVKKLDPEVLNFVNDYNVVESYDGRATAELYLQEIRNIESYGGTVDGIGVQGHFNNVDLNRMKAELDILATAGKPIWVTELDISISDPIQQADGFESIMREAFAHPAIEGIVLWGPARPNCTVTPYAYKDKTLCEHPFITTLADANFVEKPIGLRYLKLRKEWSSKMHKLTKNGVLRFRGFFGSYRVRLYVGHNLTSEQFFHVPKGSSQLEVNIRLS